jgi:hypothetical protein
MVSKQFNFLVFPPFLCLSYYGLRIWFLSIVVKNISLKLRNDDTAVGRDNDYSLMPFQKRGERSLSRGNSMMWHLPMKTAFRFELLQTCL